MAINDRWKQYPNEEYLRDFGSFGCAELHWYSVLKEGDQWKVWAGDRTDMVYSIGSYDEIDEAMLEAERQHLRIHCQECYGTTGVRMRTHDSYRPFPACDECWSRYEASDSSIDV